MRKSICILLLFFLTSLSAYSQKRITEKNYVSKGAPNMVQVNDSLFCDQTEMSNINWLLYLFNINGNFGRSSLEYSSNLPDTTVWESLDEYLREDYLRYPGFRIYPIVGVSLEQAKAFAHWRTEIVFQSVLEKIGKKPLHDSLFSIAGYFEEHPEDIDKLPYFEFRVPTHREWELSFGYSVKIDSLYSKERLRKRYSKNYLDSGIPQNVSIKNVFNGKSVKTRRKPILNMHGNVAELIQEESYSMGGCWIDGEEIKGENSKANNNGPNVWTGFRCVGSWEKWKP